VEEAGDGRAGAGVHQPTQLNRADAERPDRHALPANRPPEGGARLAQKKASSWEWRVEGPGGTGQRRNHDQSAVRALGVGALSLVLPVEAGEPGGFASDVPDGRTIPSPSPV